MESSAARKDGISAAPKFDHLHFSKADSGYDSFYTSEDSHIATNIIFSTPNYKEHSSLLIDESSIKVNKLDGNFINSNRLEDTLPLSSSSGNEHIFYSNTTYQPTNTRESGILSDYNRISGIEKNVCDQQLFLLKHTSPIIANENQNILNIDHGGFTQNIRFNKADNFVQNQSWNPENLNKQNESSNACNENLLTPVKRKVRRICENGIKKSGKKAISTEVSCRTNKVKRKLHIPEECKEKITRQTFYNDTTRLSLIEKLESFRLPSEKIFDYLSGCDIFKLSLVSQNYKRIVQSNPKAFKKLCDFQKEKKKVKENYEIKVINPNLPNFNSRVPFSTCNGKTDFKPRQLSPKISPSKRRFHENQKVVRTLSNNDKLIRCPRCSNYSRIVKDTQNDDIPNFNSLPIMPNHFSSINSSQPYINLKQYSLRQSSILSDQNNEISQFHNRSSISEHSIKSDVKLKPPYGKCTRMICNFVFCLKCSCDYHSGPCLLTKQVSPSKEDVENGILQMQYPIKRDKKSSRKSLRRLCF